jgi:hypothetical protein
VAAAGRYEGAKAEKAVPFQTSLPIDLVVVQLTSIGCEPLDGIQHDECRGWCSAFHARLTIQTDAPLHLSTGIGIVLMLALSI